MKTFFHGVRRETMKIYVARHGQTDWNVAKHIQGSNDIPLNDTGIKQAEELAKTLQQQVKLAKVYTSSQKRAKKTAEIVAKAYGIELITLKGLEEMNLGLWEGMTWTNVEERYPAEYENWAKARRYTNTPQGESYQDVLERLIPALKEIISKEEEDVLVLTHSACIMILMAYIHKTPFETMAELYKTQNAKWVEIDREIIEALTI